MKKLCSSLIVLLFMQWNISGQANMVIEPKPSSIYIEQGSHKQIVNFDFLITHTSIDTLSLVKLTISVFDQDHQLLQTRFLDNNGTAPGLLTLPTRTWEGNAIHLIFNPFSEFEISSPIAQIIYEWTFANSKEEELTATSIVSPIRYQQSTTFSFPLKGRILVYDGHDYYSHHRRFDYTFPPIQELGLVSNFMRYAYDFVIVDQQNQSFRNQGESNEDYFGFAHTVQAVADGEVIYAVGNHPDDKTFDIPKLKENPLELYGNCIAIQHADHSISIYGHLKENSLKVKPGDRVKANQAIAQIGVSGSSFFPHLHFEVRTSISNTAEGLPSYFKNIVVVEGKTKKKLKPGLPETGNILEAK